MVTIVNKDCKCWEIPKLELSPEHEGEDFPLRALVSVVTKSGFTIFSFSVVFMGQKVKARSPPQWGKDGKMRP